MSKTIGWDIGGAHLKAVLLDKGSVKALQIPCELWRGLDNLEAAINCVLIDFGEKDAQHVVTMTGELVDLFENRRQGVIEIANFVASILGKETQFYAARSGFVGLQNVSAHVGCIASANWHASASLLAKQVKNALFVDIGSTTTDIILISHGEVAEIGLSDALRMKEDTLVYTGVVRTPLMALAQKLPFEGQQVNVAAEYFSTMADVYRLTGELEAEMDVAETADGKGKTLLESARRIARKVGHDLEDKPIETWKSLALECKKLQMQQIKQAVLKHWKTGTPIVGAGVGAFLVKQIAEALNCEYLTISQALAHELNDSLSVCFPAYAVAQLAVQPRC
ncbi:MAG: hydantoinase/oxoprolinase family protein [Methylophilaceae bacterium]